LVLSFTFVNKAFQSEGNRDVSIAKPWFCSARGKNVVSFTPNTPTAHILLPHYSISTHTKVKALLGTYLSCDKCVLSQIIDDGLVLTAVTEGELVGVAACSHTQQLVSETDAENRLNLRFRSVDKSAKTLNERPERTGRRSVSMQRMRKQCASITDTP